MINSRLASWLVAGSIVVSGGHFDFHNDKLPARETANNTNSANNTNNGRPSVLAANLESTLDSAKVRVQVPGLSRKPVVQVLPSPDRLVVDFHGVNRGAVPRSDIAKLAHPLIYKARLAQFAVAPESITRLVLELAPSVRADITYDKDGVDISLTKGVGKIRTSLAKSDFNPVASAAAVASASILNYQEPDTSYYSAYSAESRISADEALNPATSALAPLPSVESATQASLSDDLASAAGASPSDSANEASSQHLTNAERLPQIGSPYVGLPSLGAIPIAPIVAAQAPVSGMAPKYGPQPSVTSVKNIGNMETGFHGERIDLDVQNADLRTICSILTKTGGLNLVMDPDVQSGGWTYYFEKTPWDKILDIVVKNAGLGKEISDGIIRIAKVEKLKKEEEDRKALEEARALAGNLVTVTRGLSYAKVDDAQKIITNLKSERGKIFTDTRTNTMILTDLPRYVDSMQQLLDQLDVKVPQVQIDARIVEANRGWEKAFGVSWPQSGAAPATLQANGQNLPWGAENGPSWNSINSRPTGDNRLNAAFSPGIVGATDIPAPAGEIWISFLTNRISLNAIIQALESKSMIKVVSEPKLTVQNNQVGLIDDGSRIPYQSNQSGVAGGAITVQFVEAKLKLEVTPQITNEGTIILDVSIAKDAPDFGRQVNGTPTILSKNVKTTVSVNDGGTVVLGGVFTNSSDAGSVGVPFLSNLPGIGWLFRSKTNNDQTTEMLVMISPKIIEY
ncbi:MAG: type IV pilus secretin PilQ [Holophagales bacterium]|jgi:type IV pilus assembly protein PilQ|nr:type IV pilus secretin PilQ [Holophagales bacterium]